MTMQEVHLPAAKPRLYISTVLDCDDFCAIPDGYWMPTAGRAAFHSDVNATCPEPTTAPDKASSIYLYWVALHTRTSFLRFYDKLREDHEILSPGRPFPKGSEPPTRPSFVRPALILHEHEAEDMATRSGAGVTVFSAHVCLPAAVREGIGVELVARRGERLIAIGFQVAQFEFPQRRYISPNSELDRRVLTFEVDEVEIKVF